jgi:N-acetylglucosamine kinase-like BadF-type ATPase
MKYFIGIDGGGTKTKCIISDENLNILSESIGGPSNFLINGVETVSETLIHLIKNCINNLGINISSISSTVIGTAGGGRRTDAKQLENAILSLAQKENFPLGLIRVDSDARIALEGAFSGKPGSILIAGTGSIMFGKDKNGIVHRVGGFGRILGDEGSGFRLGQKALNAVSKEFDGRGPKTLISVYLDQEFSIKTPDDLINEIYKKNFDIASVAPLVFKAAENSDKIAQNIIETESDEIIHHILSMKKILNENTLFLSFIGSLLTKDNYYSYLIKEKIVKQFDDVIIKEAENPPEIGAVFMAKEIFNNFK